MEHIFITGTSSGIWNFLAENLKYDYEISWVWRRENNTRWIKYFQGDLRSDDFLREISGSIHDIDYLIINAWVWYFDAFENIPTCNHREIIETNLTSPIILTSLLLSKIKKGIIFIWSISSKKSSKFGASYSASKFWLRGFAMNLKNELKWIHIHFINPKIVKTNLHNASNIEIVGNLHKQTSKKYLLWYKIYSQKTKKDLKLIYRLDFFYFFIQLHP